METVPADSETSELRVKLYIYRVIAACVTWVEK